jgi:hypothetical protein
MRRAARELSFGLLAWLIPFAMSVCIYHLKPKYPALFESVMGLTLVGSTVVLGCLYLRRVAARWIARGLAIGCLWMAMNWLLDAVMFSQGPMKMSFQQYAAEIGPAYLLIPVITTGLGTAVAFANQTRAAAQR